MKSKKIENVNNCRFAVFRISQENRKSFYYLN